MHVSRHNQIAVRDGRNRHLAAELIFFVRLAFGDALHFWRVHAVELVVVIPLLSIDALGLGQQLLEIRGRFGQFALDIAQDPAQKFLQLLLLFARSLGLPRASEHAVFIDSYTATKPESNC